MGKRIPLDIKGLLDVAIRAEQKLVLFLFNSGKRIESGLKKLEFLNEKKKI